MLNQEFTINEVNSIAHSNLDCHVCNEPIEGEVIYGCSYTESYFEGYAYTVKYDETLASVCLDCHMIFKIEENIDAAIYSQLKLIQTPEIENKIIPIYSHFKCCKCNQKIKNGNIVISTDHSKEIWKGFEIIPQDMVLMSCIVCSSCGDASDYQKIVETSIDNVIANARRSHIRSMN